MCYAADDEVLFATRSSKSGIACTTSPFSSRQLLNLHHPIMPTMDDEDIKPVPDVKKLIELNNWLHVENSRLRGQRDRYRQRIDDITSEKDALQAQLLEIQRRYADDITLSQVKDKHRRSPVERSTKPHTKASWEGSRTSTAIWKVRNPHFSGLSLSHDRLLA